MGDLRNMTSLEQGVLRRLVSPRRCIALSILPFVHSRPRPQVPSATTPTRARTTPPLSAASSYRQAAASRSSPRRPVISSWTSSTRAPGSATPLYHPRPYEWPPCGEQGGRQEPIHFLLSLHNVASLALTSDKYKSAGPAYSACGT